MPVIIRTEARIEGPTEPGHPGELRDINKPIAALAINYVDTAIRAWHQHFRGQLVYAVSGVMQVETATGSWIVAPEQAVWIPPATEHAVRHQTPIAMRTLYIDPSAARKLPESCSVVNISPLIQQLILRATEIGVDYARDTPAWRIMMVILDELHSLAPEPMHLPLPVDPRLKVINVALQADPANDLTLADWAGKTGASERTLARLFVAEIGMTFGAWRERIRLMCATRLLIEGDSVTNVALDVGYKNTSAFIAMFKRNLDQTPAQFVKSRAGGD